MDELLDSLTEGHVYAYLFILASYSDGVFSDEEKRMLKIRVGQSLFAEMEELYLALSSDEREELLNSMLAKHFSTSQDQQKLIGSLREIFMADGVYSQEESALLQALKFKMAQL